MRSTIRRLRRPASWLPPAMLALLLVSEGASALGDDPPASAPSPLPVVVPDAPSAPSELARPVHLTPRRSVPPPFKPVPDPKPTPPAAVPIDVGSPAAPAAGPRMIYVPPHVETRTETVCDPAEYDYRKMPVYEDRITPIYDMVRVPVYEDRRVPRTELRMDATGTLKQVVVGMKTEHILVSWTMERRCVGSRTDRVKIGTRTEWVLVRPQTCRVVTREVSVPGRYVPADPPIVSEPDLLPAPKRLDPGIPGSR